MKICKILKLIIVFFSILFPVLSFSSQQSVDLKILQSEKKMIIDGALDDWSTVEEIPVSFTPEGEKIDLFPDIAVAVRFT